MADSFSDLGFQESPAQGQGFEDLGFQPHDAMAQPSQPSNPDFEVAGHSSPVQGIAPNQQVQGTPGPSENFISGLLTNQPTVGVAGTLGRTLPASIGGAIAGPLGAGAFESARQGLIGIQAAQGVGQAPTMLDAFGRPVLAAFVQHSGDLAAPYVAKGFVGGTVEGGNGLITPGIHQMGEELGGVAGGLVNGGKAVLRYLGVNGAGVPGASYDVAAQNAANVGRFVGAEPEVGDALAEKARSVINGAIQSGEDAYPKLIEAARANPEYAGKTFNLQDSLGDKVLSIADQYGFQTTPGLKAPPEAAKFWRFAQQVDGLQNASLDEVYQFQKQLNSLASANAGKPLGSAFGQLKGAVRDLLGSEIPEIGQANAQYAAAKALEEQTGKLGNANDLLGYVRNAYRNKQMTAAKEAIDSAAAKVPGLGDVINDIHAYNAAKDFGPLVRGIPQTGFGAAAIYGAGEALKQGVGMVTGDPTAQAGAMALGALGAGVASPRLALTALRVGQAAGPAFSSAAGAAGQAGAALTPMAAQALSHMSPESISAFYRSPGSP